jgi:hypothetical protein
MESRHIPSRARWGVAALALLATACSDQPTSPGARVDAPRLPSYTASPSGAALVPNAVRYSDTEQKPARGRTGSAAIEARALIGRDMVTELDLRATPADSGRLAQPSLQKVRVNAVTGGGQALFEVNHTGLSGPTLTRTYTGLAQGHTLNVQANVTGIDANRTDVVNASVPVLLRPDLGVYLDFAGRVRAGEPHALTAYVAETNGQVGARADCVLYVDGVEVDRARGIWVDAGGVVTCAFTHVFAQAGRPTVRVSVENVRPGDWDTSNNARETTVHVVAADNFFTEAVAASGTTFRHNRVSTEYLERTTGSGSEQTSEFTEENWAQFALAYGAFDHGFSSPLTIHAAQTSSGRPIHAFTVQLDSLGAGYNCFSRVDGSAAATFYGCTIDSPTWRATTFRYERNAGAVTYHSAEYGRTWDGQTGEVYTYHTNFDFASSTGTRAEFGTDYTFSLRFVGADTTITAQLTLPLAYTESNAGGPDTFCGEYDGGTFFFRSCSWFQVRETNLSGSWSSYY